MPSVQIINPPVSKAAIEAVAAGAASFMTDHLYVDDAGAIRDSHVEDMFDDLFYGRPLDAIFRNNFVQYYSLLTGAAQSVPPAVFDNVTQMRAWVGTNFGRLEIGEPHAATLAANPDLTHCSHRATFGEPKRFDVPPSYAPSELNAGLLCVVSVFRQLAKQFNDSMFKASPDEIN